jgi:hypothetical protein
LKIIHSTYLQNCHTDHILFEGDLYLRGERTLSFDGAARKDYPGDERQLIVPN